MDNIVFLILRRMRYPLVTLIVVYAIAILGLVLIPGEDADGNVWHMSIFHAFYFVSYMSTTIGFGELPYAFNDAQRSWVIITLYASVISWLYTIGTILALLKDTAFRQALVERRFSRRIGRLREPYVLVCGYGETGSALVWALTERGQHAVVVDNNPDRINLIKLQNLRDNVLSLNADASQPAHLLQAGLEHKCCRAVVALTDKNETNLKIAVTSKLLHPDIKVICRADSHDIENNMASFGTDHIVDPYDTFAHYFSVAFQSPCLYLLQRWLTGETSSELPEPVYPPTEGHWIICGYGRFGKAIYERLRKEGVSITIIEANPEQTGAPPTSLVEGRGTEAETLIAAGIEKAAGLIAGTNDDVNNLSIIMTARAIKADIFVVVRQNKREHDAIVDAVKADMVMHPSAIIAERIRVLLANPALYDFLNLAIANDDAWACELVSRITGLVSTRVPDIQEILLDEKDACAVVTAIDHGKDVQVKHLLTDPLNREKQMGCMLLLLIRDGDRYIVPDNEMSLKRNDKLLFCGRNKVFTQMSWTFCHEYMLEYILTGEDKPRSWLWRKLAK